MNCILTKRILTLIAQTYAFNLDELEKIYQQVDSLDSILSIIEICKNNNTLLVSAFDVWKEIDIKLVKKGFC